MLDAARERLSRALFSPLQGMTASTWRALRRENDVSPRYRARAAFQSANSLFNAIVARFERRRFGPRIEAATVAPPLFILGHFRHGTTHLHNLLAQDPRFSFPGLYPCLYPETFLTTQRLIPRLGRPLLLRRRPHDNVALSFAAPNEDELALCNATGLSPYLSWAFPARASHYDRYLTFRDVPGPEVARWKSALFRFYRALSLGHGRTLVLKSPPHTARIPLLLALFPDARFVHIRRHPGDVFRSTMHMTRTTRPYWLLHDPPPGLDDEARILAQYTAMYDAYFDGLALVPPGQLCEVRYEDLDRDPIGPLETVYGALSLGEFAAVRPRLESYVASLGEYQKNRHADLPDEQRRRVATAWGRSFEAWGYEP